ncbi:DUF3593 domain-containing protein [Synechococcus sp. CS-1332]|uniref:DUF3593 domain-containing protein n=1 Tax=Synechococcus sp. CS-1332 TaxID=2847972 RepID=UPI00223AE022|nr:DUF3593 domain-containing protein [Synechococcus sp. CS-1332]MCT0207690.1 DUF3593 domain-containing protein [Synechococcus sp. CS-1332]
MTVPLAEWFQRLGGVDPSPFFVLSLLPYLAFLWWAQKVRAFPRLALRGFQLTLLFVAVTIAAAVVAQLAYGRQLADVDPLHGGAEAFLTLSNLVVLLGFRPEQTPPLQPRAAPSVPSPSEEQQPPDAPR